jgi:hypothetical protein
MGCAGDAAVRATLADQHIRKVERVIHLATGFVESDTLGAAHFIVCRGNTFPVGRAPVVHDSDPGQSTAHL